ncbi:MAG: right-handed parallel beta-helix repeat-containing protein [Phycisphaerales bacterium]|nr:right-handed parallel beta-helix repeat-containing protein [Phycisphaerae bacterium]NNF43601.1 right-handed parallel beta-helix repeat-containing protein [Phycisphaerales bacterium]NNM26084.1 right-handed parallel beta-helix repeat-containing protein [Phycisphaerales bacterium]
MNRMRGCWSAVLVGACAAATPAADITVPGDFMTIQAAMDNAKEGDVIILTAPLYRGEGNKDLVRNIERTYRIKSASGDPSLCTIDCEGSGRGFFFGTSEPPSFVVEGITILSGSAATGAGMLFTNDSSPTILNCVFAGNHALATGGGVFCANSDPLLLGCTFVNNTSNFDGGGMVVGAGAEPTLIGCSFNGNTASDRGGAVLAIGGGGSFINCVFTNNTAEGTLATGGGAVAAASGSVPYLANCSFAMNQALGADASGGALTTGSASNVLLANCIMWSDIPDEIETDGGTALASYSNIRGGWPGPGNLGDDLATHDPRYVDPAAGDLRLDAGSVSIDAGNNFALPTEIAFDVAGEERFRDDPGVPDTGLVDMRPPIDMGAYEFQGSSKSTCLGDTDGDGLVGFTDLVSIIALWGPCPPGDCPQDVSGDGVIGFSDLLTILSFWGPCV